MPRRIAAAERLNQGGNLEPAARAVSPLELQRPNLTYAVRILPLAQVQFALTDRLDPRLRVQCDNRVFVPDELQYYLLQPTGFVRRKVVQTDERTVRRPFPEEFQLHSPMIIQRGLNAVLNPEQNLHRFTSLGESYGGGGLGKRKRAGD